MKNCIEPSNTNNNITPRLLRHILREVSNQEMTVKELRKLLFDMDTQDKLLNLKVL